MQGNTNAIMMQGITRNATKIGVKDGQAEDLINLRFMDGSWRASGDGRIIDFTMDRAYQQLYVHTNIYHHLLGVYDGTLYWFAEIGTDGVTFYPLDNTTSRTSWPTDYQSLPTAPVALTQVVGNIWITQTGHMLTIIDENDDFEYFVFKTGDNAYISVNLDVNGRQTDRTLFPYGSIHFNLYEPFEDNPTDDLSKKGYAYLFSYGDVSQHDYSLKRNTIIKAFGKVQEKNRFTRPFLACAALKIYDGSYIYSSNPVLLWPRGEALHKYFDTDTRTIKTVDKAIPTYKVLGSRNSSYASFDYGYPELRSFQEYQDHSYVLDFLTTVQKSDETGAIDRISYDSISVEQQTTAAVENYWFPVITECLTKIGRNSDPSEYGVMVLGSDLVCSIDTALIDLLNKNQEVFESLCIFVTPEVDIYNLSASGFEGVTTGIPFFDMHREMSDIKYDLTHYGFYLLKEYNKYSISELITNPIIDLSGKENEEILKNIVQKDRLAIESTNRTTYLPKVSYMYNGRLHIANYKSYPFFGYPIDLFHLHNHSVKVQANSWFKGVLPNLAGNNDDYLQYARETYNFPSTIPSGCEYFAFIEVTIESTQGEQKVVRYIAPYEVGSGQNGRADFVEELNPLITYPDARAKHIKIVRWYNGGQYGNARKVEFDLKPHPYMNIAYYIDPDLKPISLAVSSSVEISNEELPQMQNVEEYFPNGLKVSKADNPMFFPVEYTYQIGSAEILALMTNTIAVGTGQTGEAPLYIFCKDGVYAAFVDASGEMVYPNTRPLAPDVCNNPRSVTRTDLGVVFTTDRGLMRMVGEQVDEIGAPAEGDVLQYVDSTKVDYSKIATDALTKIAGLPSNLCDTTDFLTYLQGAIVNYNHNLRELIVTNPEKSYSYILDRDGNWSRRDYTASEYVNNYPTSYRVVNDGTSQVPVYKFYKMDDEGDASTSLEHRKEADNQIFYLSNVIKLDSIGFKQAYRFVVRGYFETLTGKNVGCVVEGSYDGIKFAPLGFNRKSGKFTNIGCHVSHTDVRFFRIVLCGQVTGKTRIDYMEMSADGSMLNTKLR